jgi:hypothetical protein
MTFTIPPLPMLRDYVREIRNGLRATLHVAPKHGPKDLKYERANRIVRADHIDDIDTLAWRALEKVDVIGERLENEHKLVAAAEALVEHCALYAMDDFGNPNLPQSSVRKTVDFSRLIDGVREAVKKSKEPFE